MANRTDHPGKAAAPRKPWATEEAIAVLFVGVAAGLIFLLGVLALVSLLGQVGTVLVLMAGAAGAGHVFAKRWLSRRKPLPVSTQRVVEQPDLPTSAEIPTDLKTFERPEARSVPKTFRARDTTPATASAPFPAAEMRFVAGGESLWIAGRDVGRSLLYVGAWQEETAREEPSLLDPALPVGEVGAITPIDLPYWPTYRDCDPAQRGMYLDWLASGCDDANVGIGYVFLIFYGLERRALIDQQDHDAVLKALLFLLERHAEQSGSFRRYATSLAWQIVAMSIHESRIKSKRVVRLLETRHRHDAVDLAVAMAFFQARNEPMPEPLAWAYCRQDPRCINSVVARRNPDRFRTLFRQRWQENPGLLGDKPLIFGKRPQRVAHQPANNSLLDGWHESEVSWSLDIPDATAITRQFKPWAALWNRCVDDLKGFDRLAKVGEEPAESAEAYEALPVELRVQDHPHLAAWSRLRETYADRFGVSLIPVGELAETRDIEFKASLSKRDSLALAEAGGRWASVSSRTRG
ncbi:MAG: TerB N-terminal domain-containing protein [Planctomycetota bacterium]